VNKDLYNANLNLSKDYVPALLPSFDPALVSIGGISTLQNASGCKSMESTASVSMHMIVEEISLTPKIPGPFLPISTSKMLKFSKKSSKKFKK
jgi:hypothetical protein